MKQPRKKCLGRTRGDFRGSYPCALYAKTGSDYCRYHEAKAFEEKPNRFDKKKPNSTDEA